VMYVGNSGRGVGTPPPSYRSTSPESVHSHRRYGAIPQLSTPVPQRNNALSARRIVLFTVILLACVMIAYDFGKQYKDLDDIGRERRHQRWKEIERHWDEERERHQREHERWDRERKEHEGEKRREDEGRGNTHFYWGEIEGAPHCASFGVREYTARLWNIPVGRDWMSACYNQPIQIHNVTIAKPSSCEDKGLFGGVVGHWLVNFAEVLCSPYWGKLYDKGCTAPGSGIHRFEARLWDIHHGEDQFNMCNTSPIDILGAHIDRPSHCEYRGIFFGMVGMWELEDRNC